MKACAKLSKPKRKIFDSGKQRADGSDVIYSKTKETKKVQILGEKAEVSSSYCAFRIYCEVCKQMSNRQHLTILESRPSQRLTGEKSMSNF